MDNIATSRPIAWQPLTFGGVAAFAQAPFGRLLFVQFIVALLAAGSIVFYFRIGWNSPIQQAIDQLPAQGEIAQGELRWTGPAPLRLGEGTFVSFVLDPENSGELGQAADMEWILTRRELRLRSLFGYLSFAYPADWTISISRAELKPWWGAWQPTILTLLIAAVVIALFVSWWMLSAIYVLPVRLIAFYSDRKLSWAGAWRLAGAVLLPGAAFMSAAILAYGIHRLNLLQLLAAAVAHFVIGWVFVVAAPTCLPRLSLQTPGAVRPRNPFVLPETSVSSDQK